MNFSDAKQKFTVKSKIWRRAKPYSYPNEMNPKTLRILLKWFLIGLFIIYIPLISCSDKIVNTSSEESSQADSACKSVYSKYLLFQLKDHYLTGRGEFVDSTMIIQHLSALGFNPLSAAMIPYFKKDTFELVAVTTTVKEYNQRLFMKRNDFFIAESKNKISTRKMAEVLQDTFFNRILFPSVLYENNFLGFHNELLIYFKTNTDSLAITEVLAKEKLTIISKAGTGTSSYYLVSAGAITDEKLCEKIIRLEKEIIIKKVERHWISFRVFL